MVAVHEPVPGDVGAERLPPDLSALRGLRPRRSMPKNWCESHGEDTVSRRVIRMLIVVLAVAVAGPEALHAQGTARQGGARGTTPAPAGRRAGAARGAAPATPQHSPGAGPIVVVETTKGTIE